MAVNNSLANRQTKTGLTAYLRGTRQQLMALRNYLIENGIQFGKVE